jgi:hypothetical protein
MATTQAKNNTASIDAAFDQFGELNEQFLGTARKAGNLYVDSYEKAVGSAIELERKVAGLTHQEWLKSLLEAQADFASELAHSYTSAARALLK